MRIRFKKSSLITKLVIMVLLVYAMVTLVHLQRQLSQKQSERAALETQLAEVQQANAALKGSIDALDTDAGVEAVAREKLGLVSEGEITFYDVGN
jgi:cell division protein FtsB/cell division protein DivIC